MTEAGIAVAFAQSNLASSVVVLCIFFFNALTCQFTIHSNYISEIKLQQIDLPWPQTAVDSSGSILWSEVSEAQELLAPRFMRTHARELQKKKRENKRQRTWVAEGEGNIINNCSRTVPVGRSTEAQKVAQHAACELC